MKSITLLNEKAGVGKTTLATHIAAGLAIRGYRIVLVDADPQGHATRSLSLKKEPGLANLLVQGADFKEVLRIAPLDSYQIPHQRPKGQLYVVPSDTETGTIALKISDPFAVADRFSELAAAVDVVIFDTAPSQSLLHGSIYLATDVLLCPTPCESLCIAGLVESLLHSNKFPAPWQRWGLNELAVMGIVPVMFRSATLSHQENLNTLKARFGKLVWPEVGLRTMWNSAASLGKLLYHVAPKSPATREAWALVDHVELGLGL